ncbi:MAG TPA: hypothetical protein VGM05_33170 [Planctomycetaceae bacterium]
MKITRIAGPVLVAVVAVLALTIPPLVSWHGAARQPVSEADKARATAIAEWARREHFAALEWEPDVNECLTLGPFECPDDPGLPVGVVCWERAGGIVGAAVVFRGASKQNVVDLRSFTSDDNASPKTELPAGVLAVLGLGMKE